MHYALVCTCAPNADKDTYERHNNNLIMIMEQRRTFTTDSDCWLQFLREPSEFNSAANSIARQPQQQTSLRLDFFFKLN